MSSLHFDEFRDQIEARVEQRLAVFAESVMNDAKARAPSRKQAGDRRRGSKKSFVVGGVYTFGKVMLTTYDIGNAAAGIGINLGTSMRLRAARGKGDLQVITRRPNRKHVPKPFFETGHSAGAITTANPANKRRGPNKPGDIMVAQYRFQQAQKLNRKRLKESRQLDIDVDNREIHLKDSFTTFKTVDGDTIRFSVVAAVRHARFVEFPTSRNAAQPFLLPALMAGKARMKRALTR